MIKFFRKIRQNLLSEGKSVKYFKYAIGEIILVVIGILIALQVNNWNEQRKLKNEREVLVSSLSSDLKASQQRLIELMVLNKKAIDRTSRFLALAYSDNETVSIDSLQYYFSGAFDFPYFEPVLTSYDQAVSSGKIGLLDDKQFYNTMSSFLTSFERFKSEARVSGEVFYLGSIWELRKETGNIVALAGKYRSKGGSRKIEPDAFKLTDVAYRSFIKKPEVFAAIDNMRTIFYNVNESFQDMNVRANELITRLQEIK